MISNINEDILHNMSTVTLAWSADVGRQYQHIIACVQSFVRNTEAFLIASQRNYFTLHGQEGSNEYYNAHGYVPNSPEVQEVWELVTPMSCQCLSGPIADVSIKFEVLHSKISAVDMQQLKLQYQASSEELFGAAVGARSAALAALQQWRRVSGAVSQAPASTAAAIAACAKLAATLIQKCQELSQADASVQAFVRDIGMQTSCVEGGDVYACYTRYCTASDDASSSALCSALWRSINPDKQRQAAWCNGDMLVVINFQEYINNVIKNQDNSCMHLAKMIEIIDCLTKFIQAYHQYISRSDTRTLLDRLINAAFVL